MTTDARNLKALAAITRRAYIRVRPPSGSRLTHRIEIRWHLDHETATHLAEALGTRVLGRPDHARVRLTGPAAREFLADVLPYLDESTATRARRALSASVALTFDDPQQSERTSNAYRP